MRGWENGFISQQQMLATHTALLRNFDRKSHHNPTDHLKVSWQQDPLSTPCSLTSCHAYLTSAVSGGCCSWCTRSSGGPTAGPSRYVGTAPTPCEVRYSVSHHPFSFVMSVRPQVERWSRSFSFSSAAMVFYLLPVMLAMLSIACRTSYRHFLLEMTLFHAAQAAPYPYPIIGVACQPDTGCLFGLSPK